MKGQGNGCDDDRRKGLCRERCGARGRRGGRLKDKHGITPGLAVCWWAKIPASQVYVSASKGKQTVEVGMASFEHKLAGRTRPRPTFSR
jgi:hypothetical protein